MILLPVLLMIRKSIKVVSYMGMDNSNDIVARAAEKVKQIPPGIALVRRKAV